MHEGTCPELVPINNNAPHSCELPSLCKNLVMGAKICSKQCVPWILFRVVDKSLGHVSQTKLLCLSHFVNCLWDKPQNLRKEPNEKVKPWLNAKLDCHCKKTLGFNAASHTFVKRFCSKSPNVDHYQTRKNCKKQAKLFKAEVVTFMV